MLVDALAERGVRAELVAWDAPSDWAAAPLVVVRTPWDYVERHEQFLDALHEIAAVTTLVNPAGLVAWNHHKGYLAELARAGVPVVPLEVVARGAGAAEQEAALSAFGDEIVVKPAISGGAWGTIRTRAGSSEAREHLAELVRTGDALVQPYLDAVEAGEVSLDVLRRRAVPRRAQGARPTATSACTPSTAARWWPHTPTAAELAVARAVLAAAPDAATYARIDLVTSAAGPLLMEAELIDPELFLPRSDPRAAPRFAGVLVGLLDGCARGAAGRSPGEHGRTDHEGRRPAARPRSDRGALRARRGCGRTPGATGPATATAGTRTATRRSSTA